MLAPEPGAAQELPKVGSQQAWHRALMAVATANQQEAASIIASNNLLLVGGKH